MIECYFCDEKTESPLSLEGFPILCPNCYQLLKNKDPKDLKILSIIIERIDKSAIR